ncbi:reverse transcriptase family protein [Clostridium felsineum]|uniref:hypothetical protein n=1 Tax=Clostridium felsineum TaxID=36839 RepID=UPI0009C8066C|nr:hypothetical protein CLAUR_037270 [Clostridium felsineum]
MKNSKEIQELQTTSYKEGWSCEIRVELQNSMRVHSISTAFNERKDNGKLYETNLLERILYRQNMNLAYKRIKSNKGSHGVDGMKVEELLQYLKQNGKTLIASIFNGTYRPKAVRRVEILKPDGGIRLLGIPTVVARKIKDKRVLKLIRLYLQSGVMINGIVSETERGCP